MASETDFMQSIRAFTNEMTTNNGTSGARKGCNVPTNLKMRLSKPSYLTADPRFEQISIPNGKPIQNSSGVFGTHTQSGSSGTGLNGLGISGMITSDGFGTFCYWTFAYLCESAVEI